MKGKIYYVTIAKVIFSHEKISSFRAKAHLVFDWCLYNKHYFESTLIIYVLLCGYALCRNQIQGGHGKNGFTHSSTSPEVPDCFPYRIVSFALIKIELI